MIEKSSTKEKLILRRVAGIILVAATAWVIFEWLFFVTKPSFMSLYSPWEKAAVLASTALIISVALLLGSLPFMAVAWLVNRVTTPRIPLSLVVFLPAILLLALAMLVAIDNFSLTLFGWGVRNSSGAAIYFYRLITMALLILAAWLLHGLLGERYSINAYKALTVTTGMILASSFPLLMITALNPVEERSYSIGSRESLPNILIVSGDGISANHMSLYGYDRPTTPFLDSVRDEFLIAENHFTNASDTGGSVISLLSGKLPTTTRVIYPPDVLRGKDSFQHLPGLLKKLGYYNADISMRHYADPYDLNMRDGFAEANFRRLKDTGGTLVATIRKYPALNPASLLIDRMSERMSERFDHIWKNKKMQDPMAAVNRPDRRWIRDNKRMEEIHQFIGATAQPFFLNVHMMVTHGERFRPSKRVYSSEADYPTSWNIDGYDDAIVDFDRHVQEIYQLLRENDLLENTLLVISSDHGFKHSAIDRIPMMLRLPGGEITGAIGGNTQRLDIAPTLLDAVGIEPADWMEGRSMLEPAAIEAWNRTIFVSGSRGEKSSDGNFWSVSTPKPPWYSLGKLFLIYCDQGFTLLMDSMDIAASEISGSTMVCENKLSPDEARHMMLSHLKEKGYSWE
jgi:arylsulfatase A-like enzyme